MNMEDIREDSAVMKYTTDIVSAFIQGNKVEVSEISDIMDTVHAKVVELCRAGGARALTTKPAVAVEDSVTPDHIICLEDGKSFKMLKKHLQTNQKSQQISFKVEPACGLPDGCAKLCDQTSGIGQGQRIGS